MNIRIRPQVPASLDAGAQRRIKDALLFYHGNPGRNIGSTGVKGVATTPVALREGIQVNAYANGFTYAGGYSAVPITVIVDFRTLGSPPVGGSHALWTSCDGTNTNSGLYFRYDASGALSLLKSQVALIGSSSFAAPSRGCVAAFTYDGTNYKIAADGVILTTGASAQSCNYQNPLVGVEGVQQVFSGDVSNAVFRSCQVFPAVLSDADLISATRNPYQFVQGAKPMLYAAPAGGGTVYNDTIAESFASAFAAVSSMTAIAAFTESATMTASQTSAQVANATITETATLVDQFVGGLLTTGSIAESITPTDGFTVSAVFAAAIAEAWAAGDSNAGAAVYAASLSQSVALSDAYIGSIAGGAQTYNEAIAEAVTVADALIATGVMQASFAEQITAGATVAASQSIAVAVSEGIALADGTLAQWIVASNLTEVVSLADAYGARMTMVATLSEQVALLAIVSSQSDLIPNPARTAVGRPRSRIAVGKARNRIATWTH
jgi:hypothetical protein